MIGKLQRLHLREVWPEAYDFTTWLQENPDVLNEELNLSLTSAEREQNAGAVRIDLVAEDESGNTVIIENQLEQSNHDHLGKVVTHLAALGAQAAIWIVADPRPEHVRAVSWLNESTAARFYLVRAEAVRIDDSLPAPLLTLITGPSEESREVGEKKKEGAERHHQRYEFWSALLERARTRTKLHANISPSRDSWISAGAGKSGLGYAYVARQHDARVELYINGSNTEENKEIFDFLRAERERIEEVFGEPLDWQRLNGKQSCRIRKIISIGGYQDEERWTELHDAMVEAMIRLHRSLSPVIDRMQI